EEAWREEAALAEQTRDAALSARASATPGILAFVDGHLEDAVSLLEEYQARGRDAGIELGTPRWLTQARLLLGRTEGLLDMLGDTGRPQQALRSSVLASIGRTGEVRAIRDRFGDV